MSDLLPICSLQMVDPIEAALMGIYLLGRVVRYGPCLGLYLVSAKLSTKSFDVEHPVRSVAMTNWQYYCSLVPLRTGL